MHSAFAAQALKVQTQNKRTQNKPKSCNSLVLVQLELREEGGGIAHRYTTLSLSLSWLLVFPFPT